MRRTSLFVLPVVLGAAVAAHAGGPCEGNGPTRSTHAFVARYLEGLRTARSLAETQRFRLEGGSAWQVVHDIANHSPPLLRRRELDRLERCAGGRLAGVEPLVSADRERRVRVRVKGRRGGPGCTGELGLLWHKGRWWIVTEKWRPVKSKPARGRRGVVSDREKGQ